MYVVYAVERWRSQGARNILHPYTEKNDLINVGLVGVGGGYFVEIWELEFDEYPEGLATTLRVTTDTWDSPTHHIGEILDTDCPEIQQMLDTPDPKQPNLTWCVQVFKERYAQWDDPLRARGACTVASHHFAHFCRAKGLAVPDKQKVVTVYFGNPAHETPDFPRECHSVYQYGRIVVDWTARQFGPTYRYMGLESVPYPLVWVNRTGQPQAFKPR